MNRNIEMSEYRVVTIDARDKSFGRLASEVAVILQGKKSPAYERNRIIGPRVKVENLSGVRFTGKKMATKAYRRHTGYIGHLKEERLGYLWAKKPAAVFKKTVSGMLPRNKLRKRLLNRLEVHL